MGESEPNPYFYQNLAEAEYAVALYMYMRLLGYPAERISILTTYNGQKHLIRDVINQRCANNSFFRQPNKVTTVDRFQGQQNDYIILSLVRTKAVGHLRDVRRLVVAMSRARLGLYIFARVSLFQNCYELTPAFNQLTARPLQLHIRPHEYYTSMEQRSAQPDQVVKDMPEMANLVYNMYMHMIQSTQQNRQQNLLDPPCQVPESQEKMEVDDGHPETEQQRDAEEDQAQTDLKPEQTEEEEEQREDHAKMPEHPGRDSDSGDSDEDEEP